MTITEFILGMFEGKSGHYAMIRRALYAPTAPVCNRNQEPVSDRSISAIVSRLQREGLIERNPSGLIKLLTKGRRYLRNLRSKKLLPSHQKLQDKKTKKGVFNTIVLYDIPEKQRRSRDWLRIELVALNFFQLQKSVWVGSGRLPEEFPQQLEKLGILKHVHVFTIQKRGTLE